ncbi:MAG: hypothetical protein WCP39_03210 [Chlamydiota bacterium]
MKNLLSIVTAINLSIFLVLLFMSLNDKGLFKSLEVQNLVVRSSSGKGVIQLGFDKEQPMITVRDGKEKLRFQLFCKDEAIFLEMYDSKGSKRVKMEGGEISPSQFVLFDDKEHPRMQLECKENPAIFLKNQDSKTISSWTILQDGGAGFGLADGEGVAASILRGGKSPGVAFFSHQKDPLASLGIMNDISHLFISGKSGNEGVVIHGGKTSGMMVLDEMGTLKLFISKNGIFQGKEQSIQAKETNPKFFTDDKDYKSLFPDQEELLKVR